MVDKIFMMILIQVLLDWMNCVDYKYIVETNKKNNILKAKMIGKCTIYQFNEDKIESLEVKTKKAQELKSNVKKATDQLK